MTFHFRITKLANHRELERLKNKWWIDNPLRKICKEDIPETEISIQNIGMTSFRICI